MSRATPRPCPHDLRPGTTVCLHCRREANLEARARRRGRVLRVAGALSALAVLAIAVALFGVRGSAAGPLSVEDSRPLARRATTPARQIAQAAAAPVVDTTRRAPIVASAAAPVASVAPSPTGAAGAAASTPAARPATPSLAPVIPQGRHDIDAAMFAERTGDTVFVHFDTPETRTRRPEKFERTVRQTLPAVYGAVADSMLAAVPEGHLTAGGDLLTELPTRGIRLTAPNGAAITVWPETRPGEDGPLVVTYRVAPAR